jgi:hypothetical protein
VPDQTLRYRAQTRLSYAAALTALTEHARAHPEPDFVFGPLDLERLENEGLAVSGGDLAVIASVLAKVPGLAETLA